MHPVKDLRGAGLLEPSGNFTCGSKPLWWQPSFLGMFTDPYTDGDFLREQVKGE